MNRYIARNMIVILILLVFLIPFIVTLYNERTPSNKVFREGVTTTEMPDGLFRGIPPSLYKGAWFGKQITASESRGINLFESDGVRTSAYPFRISIVKGLRDADLDVFRFDYGVPENPWWFRFAMDEVREIAPGQYFGKIYLRVIPGVPMLVGYFGMNKE